MRVLMITASASYGGGPQHIYDLAKLLRSSACIDIACPQQEPFCKRFLDVIDGQIFELPVRSFSILHALRMLSFTKQNKISLIHSHGKGAGTYGRFISLVSKLPLVHTPHGIHIEQYGRLMRAIYFSYEHLTGWISKRTIHVSESEQKRAFDLKFSNQTRSCVIFNGVTSQYGHNFKDHTRMRIRRDLDLAPNEIVVMSLSRFDYAKNMMEMISLAAEAPDVKFVLLGDGPDLSRVRSAAAELQTNNVYLPGFVENPMDYLAAAELYCSTSRWEGMPLAILQAMSVALPVVASRVIGNCDAVEDRESGYLYELGNIHEAATYIKTLAADETLRRQLGTAGRIRQQDQFSMETMAAKTMDVYRSVLNAIPNNDKP
jgi:glycosyltransferase involved in cell wall biosynthesis